jgi:MFS family permease
MKMKKLNKYPKEIYIFWLVEFLLGIQLIGPALLIFFKDWGGLNQTQIQSLQSWFTLWIFLLEIPTGVFGDVAGKKKSVLLGYTLMAAGSVIYTIVPNIYLFLISEFIFAAGVAFISGSKEAWLYDITKQTKLVHRYREINATGHSLHMAGMIVASALFGFVAPLLTVQQIFRFTVIPSTLAIILLGFMVRSTDGSKESLKPDYIGTLKGGIKILKNSSQLRKIAIYTGILSMTSYFVIWLYQEALRVLSIPENQFGTYRIVLLVAEILAIRLGAYAFRKIKFSKVLVSMSLIVGLSFILGGLLQNIVGVLLVLFFAGGLGLQITNLMSKETNDEICSEQRATVLSFIGMIRRLILTIFNPLLGFLVDSKGVFFAFTLLGVVSILAILFKPKDKLI